jgi:2-isopropylmalate synthase
MKVLIYDTTLRDGTQGEGVAFSVEDKIRVAMKLDELGVHYIEGGWPGSNDKDAGFFRQAADMSWKSAKITAFGSTALAKNRPENDPNLQALVAARTPAVTIFGKAWDFHVTTALRVSLSRNRDIIRDSVAFIKSQGREVIYDAEHFFDGFAANPEYALQTLKAAADGGADMIVLCDTNGGSLPSHIRNAMQRIQSEMSVPLGIHCHNDSELAVANTLAAIECGAVMAQGTMNGYGERCGNANLCSIIPNLELKMGYKTIGPERLKLLTGASRFVSQIANLTPRRDMAFVGKSAFAHKGGVHVSAIIRNPSTYEHVLPGLVGNARRVLVSELSGKSNLMYKAHEMKMDINQHEKLSPALQKIKQLENEGYEFEAAEASVRVIMETAVNGRKEFFEIDNFRVITDMHGTGMQGNEKYTSEATVKVRVGEEWKHTVAEGDGPVHALDKALRLALNQFFEPLRNVRLIDYKVRVLPSEMGTASKVRVHILQSDGDESWTTVGVSENILEASYIALADGIRYKLMQAARKARKNRKLS